MHEMQVMNDCAIGRAGCASRARYKRRSAPKARPRAVSAPARARQGAASTTEASPSPRD